VLSLEEQAKRSYQQYLAQPALAVGGTDGVVQQLKAILAELDLLMAIDGYPTIADLRTAGVRKA
jgi:isopentenyl diphosphate isomerase/L-lactate dehydrogenase-like FMN-dependent dehydrogenase